MYVVFNDLPSIIKVFRKKREEGEKKDKSIVKKFRLFLAERLKF